MKVFMIVITMALTTAPALADDWADAMRLDQIESNQRQIIDNQQRLDRRLSNDLLLDPPIRQAVRPASRVLCQNLMILAAQESQKGNRDRAISLATLYFDAGCE
jgi:hypothetical protein